MKTYDSKDFVRVLTDKLKDHSVPRCPYCGGNHFSSTDKFATILLGDDFKSIELGQSIPAGILVCENCGHIEFFALGGLGLLPRKGTGEDEQ